MTEIIGTVSAGIIVLFLLAAGLGFLSGFFKGTFRSLLDIGTVVLNLLLSMLIATSIAKSIVDLDSLSQSMADFSASTTDPSVLELVNEINTYITSPELNSTAVSLFLALVTVIILPLVFMIVYAVMGLILKIPKILIQKIVLPKANGIGMKLGGGAIGLVSSVVSLAIFLIPIVGYVNYAYDTVSMVQAENINGGENSVVEVLEEAKNTPAFKAVHVLGGRALFKGLTTVTVEEVKISLTKETENTINVYKEAASFSGVAPNEYGEAQINALSNIEALISEMEYLPALVSSSLSFVGTQWESGNAVFGMGKPQLGDSFQPATDSIISVLADATPQTFKEDVCTLTEIVKDLIEDGMLQALTTEGEGHLLEVLENTDVISDIFVELHRNERMRPIIPALSNGMINYLYGIYDEVNGTITPPHEMMDVSKLTEDTVNKEGQTISKVIVEIDAFLKSVEGKLEDGDMLDLVTYGDFAALGRAFNGIKYSCFFSESYEFMLRTVLESKGCADLGIVDDLFVHTALLPDSDMEKMLVARQKTALLILSLNKQKDIEYGEAVEILILNFEAADAESIKSIISEDNLKSIGLKTDAAHTISGLLNSMINTLEKESIELTDENRTQEAENVGQVLTAVNSAIDNAEKDKNVFKTDEADETSTSNMSATEFVSISMESEFVSNMIVEATVDENGDEVDDPYNVKNNLSENDILALESALGEEYNKEGVKDDAQKVEKLEAIAHIFGIDTTNIFN